MTITSPSPIDMELVDIGLKKGLNEHERPESLDWQQYLTTCLNVSYDDYGCMQKRPGLVRFVSNSQSTIKALRLSKGFGRLSLSERNTVSLLDYDEVDGVYVEKLQIPKYHVTQETISSWSSDGGSELCSIVVTDLYKVMVTRTLVEAGSPEYFFNIVYVDKLSSNIIRSYVYSPSPDVNILRAVVATGNTVHFYSGERGLVANRFFQITTPLAASGVINPATTVLASTSPIVDCCSYQGGSVVLHSNGSIQRFDSLGASVSSGSLGAETSYTGIDTFGSNFFTVGINGAGTDFFRKISNGTYGLVEVATIAHGGTTGELRVAVDPTSSRCVVLVYRSLATVSAIVQANCEMYTVSPGDASLVLYNNIPGWVEASLPFWKEGIFYVLLANKMSGNNGATEIVNTIANSVCLVQLPFFGTSFGDYGFRAECVVDRYIANIAPNDSNGSMNWTNFSYPHRPVSDPFSTQIYVATNNIVSSGSVSFDLCVLEPGKADVYQANDNVFGFGGYGCYYDHWRPVELGFVSAPSVYVDDTGVAGNVNTGLHSYSAIYEYKCFDGASRYSRTALPSSLTLAANRQVDVTVSVPPVGLSPLGSKHDKTVVRVYRTTAGGTVMYLIGSFQVTSTVDQISFVDNTSDTDLIAKPQLIRQPLINGAARDRYHTLSPTCLVKHNDRVFYANGESVFYSSFLVDGEAPWFNPSFTILVHGGTGPITGLASVDGVLVVFKKDSVFMIDGDGPPENGGNGTEFSTPRRIQSEFGCVDQRSILPIPDGLLFRSVRGIEALGSNARIKFVGENVSQTVDSHPYTLGAVFDRREGRAMFLLASDKEEDRHIYSGSMIVVLDMTTGAWATWQPAVELQDIVYAEVEQISSQPTLMYLGTDFTWCEAADIRIDNSTPIASPTHAGAYVPMVLETARIRGSSLQDRLYCTNFYVLAENLNNHDLKVYVAYDSGDYEPLDTFTFEADHWVGEDIKQIDFQVPRPECQSIRFKIEDSAPSELSSYPVLEGRGPRILGMAVKLGKIGGGAKLRADAKG